MSEDKNERDKHEEITIENADKERQNVLQSTNTVERGRNLNNLLILDKPEIKQVDSKVENRMMQFFNQEFLDKKIDFKPK